MAALQVAQCPRCKSALVFGEKSCVHCGQTFQYGASAPPEPTPAQIKAALAVAGAPPRPERANPIANAGQAQAQASLDAAVRARTQPAASPGTSPGAPRGGAMEAPRGGEMEGLDTGRFNAVGTVQSEEIPGFVDSSLFKAFTPAHVDTQQVNGFDGGRFAEVGQVAMAAPVGLEATARDEVDVGFVGTVSGIFGSDIYNTRDVEVQPPAVEGLDASPSVQRATKLKRVPDNQLTKIVCRCGETHRFPRCPSCGTAHPTRQND